YVYEWDEWATSTLSFRHAFLPINPLLWRLLSFRPIGKGFVNSKTKKKKAGKRQSKGGAVSVYADIASHMSHAVVNSLAYPFVDENGNPVPPGTRSAKIYLTNLFNQTLPLIRYEITDQVTLLADEKCACGSNLHRIDDIQGRLEDMFSYQGGVIVHPVVFESVFEHYPSVVEYQVRQTKHGVAISLLTNGPVSLEQLERDVAEYLEKS